MPVVPALEVLRPGPLTTIQDLGRPGLGRYGVAPSGAIDFLALRLGNRLVGNGEGAAGIEITLLGFRVRALTDLVVAVTGGDLSPTIDGRPIKMWRSLTLKREDILNFKARRTGARAYLTVGGGIEQPMILGSRSTNLAARFGGLNGRPLKQGDVLAVNSPENHLAMSDRGLAPDSIPDYSQPVSLRVVFGPQDDQFTPLGRARFTQEVYQVTQESDRTGVRLKGPEIERTPGQPESILSEGLVSGAVQVLGHGQPVIILTETSAGGYRKIAGVITADLWRVGQLVPGDRVSFAPISIESAHQALRDFENSFARPMGDYRT